MSGATYKDLGLDPQVDFKNPGNNQWRTSSLFWEFRRNGHKAYWTLKDFDHIVDGETFHSLKDKFLSYRDPTGYQFAIEVFGSWPLFQAMEKSYDLKNTIQRWKDELDVMLMSEGIKSIVDEAANGKSKASAAKYLIEKGWVQKKGRPSKAAIQKEANKMARVMDEVDEDLKRVATLLN